MITIGSSFQVGNIFNLLYKIVTARDTIGYWSGETKRDCADKASCR